MKGLSELDDATVQLAFADPPFNIGYDYDEYDDRRSSDDYLGWCRKWIDEHPLTAWQSHEWSKAA